MHRTLLRLSSTFPLACLACSADGARVVGPDEWDVVFEAPEEGVATVAVSPDGALFLGTTKAIYRYVPGASTGFEPLMPAPGDFFYSLTAPSRHAFYFLVGGLDPGVVRWQDGIGSSRIVLPAREAWMTCGDDCFPVGLPLYTLWARSDNEAWAAGRYGIVVRILGDTGRLERTPMLDFAREALGSDAIYRADLSYIAGDGDMVLIGSASALLRSQGGTWDTLPNPWRRAPGCAALALVIQGDTYLFGGHIPFPGSEMPCMTALAGERADRLDGELRGFGQPGIFKGALQPDRSALFHASAYGRGEVAIFRGRRAQILAFPELEWFAGAAVLGRYAYAAGQLGESAVVIRTPLGSRYTVPQN